ncbi:hypothetical protein ADUPG1_002294, partial [Aduncisulcus paluster]
MLGLNHLNDETFLLKTQRVSFLSRNFHVHYHTTLNFNTASIR